MSRRFRFRQVDVFTDRPLRGNALAVFLDAEGMSDEEMQSLAGEMNLAETTFVLPATDAGRAAGADYRLRIFTSTVELPFAGHPAIGTAWALAEAGRFELIGRQVEIRQEMLVGVLPLVLHVSHEAGRAVVDLVTLTMAQPELMYRIPADELDELAATLEIRSADLRWPGVTEKGGQRRAPAVISCGLPYLVVPFSRLDLLADLDADHALALARFAETYGADSAALVAPGNSGVIVDADVHVRVFLGYRAGRRGAAHRVVIEQGVEMGRPSRLVAEVDFAPDGEPTRARVTGAVAPIAEGWVELP